MGRPNTSKMATTSGKSSGAQTTRGWDPYKTFDVSEKEMQLVQERAKVRNALKAEYQKKISYPFRGIGGYIFDPSVQRFLSMRAKHFTHFKSTPKNFAFFIGAVVAPIVIFTYASHVER